MRIWFDTEFIEDGKTIELLSIGMVREDGVEFYAELDGVDYRKASPWVRENVLPHLTGEKRKKVEIAKWIRACAGETPEFWAYYADYDWVALCQLYGTMIDLPSDWPKYCLDVKQYAYFLGDPVLPTQESTEHHALNDARWTRLAWDHLERLRAMLK